MFNTLSIRIKLYLLIGTTLLLMLVLGLSGMFTQQKQNARLDRSPVSYTHLTLPTSDLV